MITSPILKGKGLFIYSDPGGARGVLSQAFKLKNKLTSFLIISDREYSFVDDYGLAVVKYSGQSKESIINDFQPDFVFTATSYTSTIELDFIIVSIKKNIKVYTFIDHWNNIKSRFKYDNQYYYPNKILVIDQKCVEIGLNEGLSPSQMFVFGHPYHDFLKTWQPIIDRKEFADLYNVDYYKNWIVYAPDPLTNVGGIQKWGIDEVEGLNILLNSLVGNNNYELILKPHPNQNLTIFDEIFKKNNVKVLNNQVSTNHLIKHSSYVIGFFSNILYESNLLGTKSISLQLGENFPILPIHDLRINLYSKESLIKIINANESQIS